MFTSIAQIEAIVLEEMAERLTWGRFVNWHGGEGKIIANDPAQEICKCCEGHGREQNDKSHPQSIPVRCWCT